MRKYGSVMALYARETLWRVLAVLAALCVVQAGVYVALGLEALPLYEAPVAGENIPLVMLTPISIVSRAAMLVICWWLLRQGSDSGSWYTLRRLNVTEQQVWACQAVYNILLGLICWGVVTGLSFGLLGWYLGQVPEAFRSGQSIFLLSYQLPELHGLLPLEDGWVWLRDIVWVLSLGTSLATGSWELRRGKHPLTTYGVAAVILIVGVPIPMGSSARLAIGTVIPALLAGMGLSLTVFSSRKEKEREEAADNA